MFNKIQIFSGSVNSKIQIWREALQAHVRDSATEALMLLSEQAGFNANIFVPC